MHPRVIEAMDLAAGDSVTLMLIEHGIDHGSWHVLETSCLGLGNEFPRRYSGSLKKWSPIARIHERRILTSLNGWMRGFSGPQRALGGRRPADLLNTPEGIDSVVRLLGSFESGSYQ